MKPHLPRRSWLALLSAAAFVPALGACGFKLRGAYQLPFDTIYIGVAPNSTLGADLARRIVAGSSTRVVASAAQAQAVLEVLSENRSRDVLSVNVQGRAQEFTLRQTMRFRVHDGKGHEYLGPTQISLKRDVAFDDSQALAFEAETELLYRDMQNDLVEQILRRLAAVKGVRG